MKGSKIHNYLWKIYASWRWEKHLGIQVSKSVYKCLKAWTLICTFRSSCRFLASATAKSLIFRGFWLISLSWSEISLICMSVDSSSFTAVSRDFTLNNISNNIIIVLLMANSISVPQPSELACSIPIAQCPHKWQIWTSFT